ncbi:MAG: DUF3078 domain-containing protein [Rhodothermales bacterium]
MLTAALLLIAVAARAQEEDTVQVLGWDSEAFGKLNLSQAGYQNWTEGGINSLASSASITAKAVHNAPNWIQTYESRLAIGVVKQDTLDFRKSEDLIRIDGSVLYEGEGLLKVFNPTAAVNARTQFAPGFNYEENPFGDARRPPVKVSDFLAPATITESVGFTYSSDWGFHQRLGVAAKETIIRIRELRVLYGQDLDESVRFELGFESHTGIDREIVRNVRLKSTLRLFASFNMDELPDALWENLLIMKVNDWLSADFEFVSLIDRDISDAVQVKEVLSIGFSVALL